MSSMASPLGVKASHLTPFLWGSQGAGSGAHHQQQRLLTDQPGEGLCGFPRGPRAGPWGGRKGEQERKLGAR